MSTATERLHSRTKIVATIGPASDSVEQLIKLIRAGVSVFRINTAHGNLEDHERRKNAIREASKQVGFEAAILLDLAGPKIRLGSIANEPLECRLGQTYQFVRSDDAQGGATSVLTSNYEKLVDELDVGDRVMLADGTVTMEVEGKGADSVTCKVVASGAIRSRQGINLPGVKLSLSALLPKDIENARWAADAGIDWISLSFVRNAEDIQGLRRLLDERKSNAMIVAKIEKPEALENLDEIIASTDAVMVARGDLGVEIDVARTPMAQKDIIRRCRRAVKPVIVATQMLESMHHSTRPTRAEASDVANAILDGTDACMLSGETAIGEYPVDTVQMMRRIMHATEAEMPSSTYDDFETTHRVHPITSAMTLAAASVAEKIDAKLIVIVTRSGNTAWVASQCRSPIPTIGISENEAAVRRMNLLWGVHPIQSSNTGDNLAIEEVIRSHPDIDLKLFSGDRIVMVKGTGFITGAHNSVVVHTVD